MANETINNQSKASFWGIHLSFWIVMFSLIVYLMALIVDGVYLFQRSLVLVTINVILFYACYFWIVPTYIQKKKIGKAAVLILLLILIIIVLRSIGDRLLMDKFNQEPLYDIPKRGRFILMFSGELTFAIFACLLKLAVGSYENKRKMAELEKLQLNTELQFLKSQMSPHFLFNSINNIYSLVLLKSDKAPEALMKLSELLRYSLYDCHDKVSLRQEIEAIESYIELFRLKYEEDLKLTFINDVEITDYQIEPLLYIPLLENALKYSGIGNNSDAFIQLELKVENNMLVFKISNSKGVRNKVQEASGIGMANIRKRLENIYPGKYVFEVYEDDTIFEVTLKIHLL
ncbi:signal transduction histidine kinase, LytS [Paludibacter propionicigenes WB4]|uniref:Signal transduction histidine kinase, LytS n=1 Tax=Paludibacter propionicigenes (strain DSM 17365 / JCM 13257 / WB4) TaxID=694427 RepID=E4T1L9_PALPW|nr:histidine kinase [Paludibacter propionicigenes]ADQ78613.1 signal transduction histidine kinase, LytS [Paludibacter propionicigenes WB4]